MSTDSKPADAGQATDPSIVDVLEKNVRAVVRITAVLTRLSWRLDAIEGRLGMPNGGAPDDRTLYEGADDEDTNVDGEPLREPSDGDELPPFAIGSDGRAILNLTYLEDADVNAYDHFVGAILSETETAELLTFLADGAADAAGRMGGVIRKSRKTSTPEDEGEQGGAS